MQFHSLVRFFKCCLPPIWAARFNTFWPRKTHGWPLASWEIYFGASWQNVAHDQTYFLFWGSLRSWAHLHFIAPPFQLPCKHMTTTFQASRSRCKEHTVRAKYRASRKMDPPSCVDPQSLLASRMTLQKADKMQPGSSDIWHLTHFNCNNMPFHLWAPTPLPFFKHFVANVQVFQLFYFFSNLFSNHNAQENSLPALSPGG